MADLEKMAAQYVEEGYTELLAEAQIMAQWTETGAVYTQSYS